MFEFFLVSFNFVSFAVVSLGRGRFFGFVLGAFGGVFMDFGGVIRGVLLVGFDRVVGGVMTVARGGVGVVGRAVRVAFFVELHGFTVVIGGQFVMLGGQFMMIRGGMVAGHGEASPSWG